MKTRNTASVHPCDCSLCDIARINGSEYKKFSKIHSNPLGAPCVAPRTMCPSPITICSICLSEYHAGKPHNCQKTTKRENMANLVRNSSYGSKSALALSALKEIASEQGSDMKKGPILLKSWSKQLPVQIGNLKTYNKKFSHGGLMSLQSTLNLSDNNTL